MLEKLGGNRSKHQRGDHIVEGRSTKSDFFSLLKILEQNFSWGFRLNLVACGHQVLGAYKCW